jgi:hypothetical protein
LNIDPSLIPPGKLDRVPLGSIHLDKKGEIDGFSFPVSEKDLNRKDLIKELRALTAKELVRRMEKLEIAYE